MAKRPTIGKNPLDALVPESHLDAVVPDLRGGTAAAREHPRREKVEELKARLAAQEAEIQTLRNEVAKLKEKPVEPRKVPAVAEPRKPTASTEPRWVTLQKLSGK